MKTREHIYDFIQKQRVAFIASVDEEGFPNMKAMYIPRKIEGNIFYFPTNTSSLRTQQFLKNPKASVYFCNKGRFCHESLMFMGTMEILKDEQTKKELWRKSDIAFYEGGAKDPDYCILKFTARKGQHYLNLETESFSIEELI
ncbi:MAG: pyridoxamine 5'-phosphate oxidase family protein [Lachnospiraceae bacterium]|nr:pyridoxamine 5'-phosphate oxidase family protein [Lachnospiraceae bacterium]